MANKHRWNTFKFFDNATKKEIQNYIASGANITERDEEGMSPLDYAIMAGNLIAVRILLEFPSVDVNEKNGKGTYPLYDAASSIEDNSLDIMRECLNRGAHIDAKNKIDEVTALLVAASGKEPEKVRLLIERKADPNSRDKLGNNAFHYAMGYNLLSILDILYKAGTLAHSPNNDGQYPIHLLALGKGNQNQLELLKKMVTEFHVNLDERDHLGRSAVFHAVENDNLEFLKLFKELGGKIDIKDDDEKTLLHIAARYRSKRCVGWLFDQGFNPNEQDLSGDTPFHDLFKGFPALEDMSIVNEFFDRGGLADIRNEEGDMVFHNAIRHASKDIVRLILDKSQLDVNVLSGIGETALCISVSRCDFHMSKFLLDERSASTSIGDPVPLWKAILNGYKEMVTLLHEYKADMNQLDMNGRSFLYYVARKQDLEMMEFLTDLGAKTKIADKNGFFPLGWAVQYNNEIMANFLIHAMIEEKAKELNTDIGELGRFPLKDELNIPNKHGQSLLHDAVAFRASASLIQSLILNGSDANMKDNNGKKPLDLLEQRGDEYSQLVTDMLKSVMDSDSLNEVELK